MFIYPQPYSTIVIETDPIFYWQYPIFYRHYVALSNLFSVKYYVAVIIQKQQASFLLFDYREKSKLSLLGLLQ